MKRLIVGTIGAMLALGTLLGAQGRGQGGPAPTPRAGAPIDLTGTWVSVVTEDWRWRMVTPPKGDFPSIPLNAEARKIAESWDPARDTAAGEQCRSYGAGNVMRNPGRVRVSWENDTTLKVETEAGTQTRLFLFGGAQPAGDPSTSSGPGRAESRPERSWQGTSRAQWVMAGGRRGGGPLRGGSLTVVTTNLRPGYLQKNGVPYSEEARVTEYFNVTTEPNGDAWMVVTTLVEDPRYLNTRFVRSSHFKKTADAGWSPTPCEAS
jgi:hypothetical protein